jgi:alkylation response protein AidB-like acyl-CoA dehydrogenase
MENNIENLKTWFREFCSERIDFMQSDERRTLPPHLFLELGRKGFFGLEGATTHGGLALKPSQAIQLMETVASVDMSVATLLSVHNFLSLKPLRQHSSETVRNTLLPDAISGRRLAAIAVTEPSAGSDPRRIESSLLSRESQFVLNGSKSWIGAGAWSGVLVTLARHEQGFTAMCLDSNAKGIVQGLESMTLGMRGVIQNSVHFKDVHVCKENLLGDVGKGAEIIQNSFRFTRISIAGCCLGMIRTALAVAISYAKNRKVSTGLLINNSYSTSVLSEILEKSEQISQFLNAIAPMLDTEETVNEFVSLAAKIVVPEILWTSLDQCLQMLGARGYTENNLIARMLRDARVMRIFEGPTEALASHLGRYYLLQPEKIFNFLEEQFGKEKSTQAQCLLEKFHSSIKIFAQDKNFLPVFIGMATAQIIFLYFSSFDDPSLAIQLELEKILLKTHYLSTKKTTSDDLIHRIEAGHLKNYVDSRKELVL